ncbi:MAG: hypothetical protein AAF468_10450 [Pseudomonadota bacterium]
MTTSFQPVEIANLRTGFKAKVVRASLISGVVFAGAMFFGPPPLHADNIGANQIKQADRAHKAARKALDQILEQAKIARQKRAKANLEFESAWAKAWEERRLQENAYKDAFNERAKKLRPLKNALLQAESALGSADRAELSARNLLTAMLENLSREEKKQSQDQALIDQMRDSVDALRLVWQRARDDKESAQKQLETARKALAERETALQEQLGLLRNAVANDTPDGLLERQLSRRLDALTKIPRPEKIAELKRKEEEAANRLLTVLIQNLPPYVSAVEATLGRVPWYSATMIPQLGPVSGNSAENSERKTHTQALSDVNAEIEKLDKLLRSIDFRIKKVRQRWEIESEYEGYNRLRIELRNRDYLIFTLAVEATAVVASAALTGGAAGPAVYGFFESLELATKSAWKGKSAEALSVLHKGIFHGFNKNGLRSILDGARQTANGKFYSEVLLTHSSGVAELAGVLPEPDDRNPHGFSNRQSIAIGDALETYFTDGASDVKDIASTLWKKGRINADAAKGLGITVAATTTKVLGQIATEMWNDENAREAFNAYAKGLAYKQTYFRLTNLRAVMRADRERYRAVRQALETLIENGPQPLMLKVSHNASVSHDDAKKTQDWEVRVTFSRPLDHPPVLMDFRGGVSFGRGERNDSDVHQWIFSVESYNVPEDAKQIDLMIGLSDWETPHRFPDADPRTPVQLTGLNRYKLSGYETGLDRNHVLKLAVPKESAKEENRNQISGSKVPDGYPGDYVELPCPATTYQLDLEPVYKADKLSKRLKIATIPDHLYNEKYGVRHKEYSQCEVYNPIRDRCEVFSLSSNSQDWERFRGASFEGFCLSKAGVLLTAPVNRYGQVQHYTPAAKYFYNGRTQLSPPYVTPKAETSESNR